MNLPGNPTHQKILQVLTNQFKKDKNVRAFIVFGSLGRGNWDNYSDLDLDVIVADESNEVVKKEIKQVLEKLEKSCFPILSAFEEAPNEQIIILEKLDRIGIRFHVLSDTKPAILNTMKIIYGQLTGEEIKKSVTSRKSSLNYELMGNKFLELAIYVPVSLSRGKLINALFFINKMRQTLIQIYINSHGLEREFDFEKNVSNKLRSEFYLTYPKCNKEEIRQALIKLLEIYQKHIGEISNNKITLDEKQIQIIREVKEY